MIGIFNARKTIIVDNLNRYKCNNYFLLFHNTLLQIYHVNIIGSSLCGYRIKYVSQDISIYYLKLLFKWLDT